MDGPDGGHGHTMSPSMAHSGGMGHDNMAFHIGTHEMVLFKVFRIESWIGILVASILLVLVGVLYEGLKRLRNYFMMAALERTTSYQARCESGYATSDVKEPLNKNELQFARRCHFLQTALHVLQVFVGYCLMLVFMTQNVFLCLAIVIGAGLGYLVFNWI